MLPKATTSEQFSSIDLQSSLFQEAAKAICIRKGILSVSVRSAMSGSLPVVFVNELIVFKFFPPIYSDGFETEVKALQLLAGAEAFAPKFLDMGSIDNWNYVEMSQLQGSNLKDLWAQISIEDQITASRIVGSKLRKIHLLEIKKGWGDHKAWNNFLTVQKQECLLRHTKSKLREDFLKQIPEFLARVNLPMPQQISFLHTEVMKDHVFFKKEMGVLKFKGFIDFEPSMSGDPEYDFASVGIFLSSGNKSVLRAFFEGYEYLSIAALSDFRKRIMAYTLLHRYSNLNWYLQFMPQANTLDELADLWWAI